MDLSGALVVSVLTATNTRCWAPFTRSEIPEKMPKAKSAASGRRRERLEQKRELKRAGGAAWRKLGADRACRWGLTAAGEAHCGLRSRPLRGGCELSASPSPRLVFPASRRDGWT